MPYFRRQGRQLTEQQRIKNLRIAIERVHVGKYYISSSKMLPFTIHWLIAHPVGSEEIPHDYRISFNKVRGH